MGNFVGRGPRILIGRYVPDAFAARLDGVHLHRREFGEYLGGVLQLDPIVLNILAGSKMAIAAVICAGDMAKLPHLAADRKSVVSGKRLSLRLDLGARRFIKKINIYIYFFISFVVFYFLFIYS